MKAFIFFITAPIMFPTMLFLQWAWGDGTNKKGWYQEVWDSGNRFQILLAILISPPLWLIRMFVNFALPLWDGLL